MSGWIVAVYPNNGSKPSYYARGEESGEVVEIDPSSPLCKLSVDKQWFVYVLTETDKDSPVKIGRTVSIRKRISDLNTGRTGRYTLRFAKSFGDELSSRRAEKTVQAHFAALAVGNEVYAVTVQEASTAIESYARHGTLLDQRNPEWLSDWVTNRHRACVLVSVSEKKYRLLYKEKFVGFFRDRDEASEFAIKRGGKADQGELM